MNNKTRTDTREMTEPRRKEYKFSGLKKHGTIEKMTTTGRNIAVGPDHVVCS